MKYDFIQLLEAKRQIDSTIHKIEETIITFHNKGDLKRYQSQITLAERRLTAFGIAIELIEQEIAKQTPTNEVSTQK